MRTYEGLFILSESASDEDLDKILERIGEELKDLGGSVSGSERLGRYLFARPMKKHAAGQYVRVVFDLDEMKIGDLLGRCKLNADIFRVQVVRRDSMPEKQAAVAEVETSGVAE